MYGGIPYGKSAYTAGSDVLRVDDSIDLTLSVADTAIVKIPDGIPLNLAVNEFIPIRIDDSIDLTMVSSEDAKKAWIKKLDLPQDQWIKKIPN